MIFRPLAFFAISCACLALPACSHGGFSSKDTQGAMGASAALLMQPVDTYDWPIGSAAWGSTNTLGGQRGRITDSTGLGTVQSNSSSVSFKLPAGDGHWIGVRNSLSGFNSEGVRTLSFGQAFGDSVKATFQAVVTGWNIHVRGKGRFKVELKDVNNQDLYPTNEMTLNSPGVWAEVRQDLPSKPNAVKDLNILVVSSSDASDVELDDINLEVQVPALPPLRLAFLLSYAQLMRSWDPTTGFADDHVNALRGSQQSVPATGFVALATAMAVDLGYVDRATGVAIVQKCIAALLGAPRQTSVQHQTHLWAHFLNQGVASSEWSTADTALAWHSAYLAAHYFDLASEVSHLGAYANSIQFSQLTDAGGNLHWGVDQAGVTLLEIMADFGAEWSLPRLMELFQNTTMTDPLATHLPPVYCDRDFIDHMGHLWYGEFGAPGVSRPDRYGVDWAQERQAHLRRSVAYLGNAFVGGLSPVEIRNLDGNTTYANLGLGTSTCPLSESMTGFDGPWRSMHSAALTSDLDIPSAKVRVGAMLHKGLLSPLSGPAESAIVGSGSTISRVHTAQVSLNSWFNTGGYYNAVVADEGLVNNVYVAHQNDTRLTSALRALFP
jgi:hypothetical protein